MVYSDLAIDSSDEEIEFEERAVPRFDSVEAEREHLENVENLALDFGGEEANEPPEVQYGLNCYDSCFFRSVYNLSAMTKVVWNHRSSQTAGVSVQVSRVIVSKQGNSGISFIQKARRHLSSRMAR